MDAVLTFATTGDPAAGYGRAWWEDCPAEVAALALGTGMSGSHKFCSMCATSGSTSPLGPRRPKGCHKPVASRLCLFRELGFFIFISYGEETKSCKSLELRVPFLLFVTE